MDLGSFEAVVSAFSAQVAELREATLLRVDDSTKQLYDQDLQAIDSTVQALEVKLRDIKAFVKREKDAIPQVEAIIEACKLQRQHLDHINSHLPTYLPSLQSPQLAASNNTLPASAAAPLGGRSILQERSNDVPAESAVPQKKKAAAAQQAPRKYIDQQEFESVSTYMRGRLTADKVNSALDEMAALAETNAGFIAGARRNKPMGADKKHATWLLYNIESHANLKGKFWFMEADLKNGTAIRLDKTGKSVLTLLRHLGRLSEVRISVDGTTHLVYSMN